MTQHYYPVYVPIKGSDADTLIGDGSAVVGLPPCENEGDDDDDRRLVYFEDGRYWPPHQKEYWRKLLHAAGRADKTYPTIARAVVDKSDLVRVGGFELAAKRFHILAGEGPLKAVEDYLGHKLSAHHISPAQGAEP